MKHTLFPPPHYAKEELEREEQLAALIACALICAATDRIEVGGEKIWRDVRQYG